MPEKQRQANRTLNSCEILLRNFEACNNDAEEAAECGQQRFGRVIPNDNNQTAIPIIHFTSDRGPLSQAVKISSSQNRTRYP